jgi:hypothetical protein
MPLDKGHFVPANIAGAVTVPEPVLSDFGDREGRAFAFLMQGAGMVAFLGAASKQPEADQ